MSYINDRIQRAGGCGHENLGQKSYVDMEFTTDDWDFLLLCRLISSFCGKPSFVFMVCASVRGGIGDKERKSLLLFFLSLQNCTLWESYLCFVSSLFLSFSTLYIKNVPCGQWYGSRWSRLEESMVSFMNHEQGRRN